MMNNTKEKDELKERFLKIINEYLYEDDEKYSEKEVAERLVKELERNYDIWEYKITKFPTV